MFDNKFIANFAYLVKQHENVYSPSEYVCVCVCGKRVETLTICNEKYVRGKK